MYYNNTIEASFEAENNKKALTYTIIICAILLALAILITWPILQPTPPAIQDLIEINLGNDLEGFGEKQPLIKGQTSPSREPAIIQSQKASASKNEQTKDIQPDDNADKDAAPVTKPEKVSKTNTISDKPITKPSKTQATTAVVAPAPKPQKPKLTYNGPGNGNGNGATEDNGYRYQGNKPGGKGDAGSSSGKPDSYGNDPGGKSGGLRVSKGDRRIINRYIFMGDLPKAVINALIKVSPEGKGTFIEYDKGSTSRDPSYATAIRGYLPNIQFDKADHESTVTVPFNFNVQ